MRRVGWALTLPALVAGAVLTLARVWQPGSGPFADGQARLAALVPLAVPAYAVAMAVSGLMLRNGRAALALLVRRRSASACTCGGSPPS